MSALIPALGVGVAFMALLVVVFMVIAPPMQRVAFERRRAPGAIEVSGLTRLTDGTVDAIGGVMTRRGRSLVTVDELEQASIRMQPPAFVLMVTSAGLVLALCGLLLTVGTLWMIPVMILFAAFAPLGAKVLLSLRAGLRRAKFADQLDESLGLVAGGLRAGHSLLRAVDATAQETESPTAEEFARIVNETRIGRELGDSLTNTANRMQSEDFRWVAQAIAINREAGGNLSEVLDQVANTIRERNEIRRQVKALAAEGKLSGIILVALPLFVFAFLLLTQPAYFGGFLDNIMGIIALVVAVILLVVGSLWMAAVVKVKF